MQILNSCPGTGLLTSLAQETLKAQFADERIGKRFRKVVELLSQDVGESIPKVCKDWANTKGAYRFFSNPRVSEEDILSGHFQCTAQRFSETEGQVLILHDTSEFSFEREDLDAGEDLVGRFPQRTECGILMHSSLAVTPAGLPLGLTAAKFWTREKFKGRNALERNGQRTRLAADEQESQRWLENMRRSSELLGDPERCVHTGDRESDIFGFFAQAREMKTHFLVRSRTDRMTAHERIRVSQIMKKGVIQGHDWIEVRNKRGRCRLTLVTIQYQRMEIAPPNGQAQNHSPLMVTVIQAKEVKPRRGGGKIDWMLITDLPVNSPQCAMKMIKWYGVRWKIELFHKTLKSGCKVEESTLQTAQRRTNLLATYCILAWRIFWMTMLKRTQPEAAPRLILSEQEIILLDKLVKDKKTDDPKNKTLSVYLRKIAQYGGYLARNNDRPPGLKVMWRGLSSLMEVEIGYILGTEKCG